MNMRQAAVAGQFYPGDRKDLQRMVEEYISQSKVEAGPERVVAIIAPHAGYIYSGPTAGYAYARIRGKQPKRVILLGCSHRYGIARASVFDTGGFAIPLGSFPIDEPFAKALAARTESVSTQPHLYEHSLEVHLPFLWVAVGSTPVVPVLFGGPAEQWHVSVGKALAEMVDESDLVIASTDLSH
jgi:AmmeMemoRadiSam system protein B